MEKKEQEINITGPNNQIFLIEFKDKIKNLTSDSDDAKKFRNDFNIYFAKKKGADFINKFKSIVIENFIPIFQQANYRNIISENDIYTAFRDFYNDIRIFYDSNNQIFNILESNEFYNYYITLINKIRISYNLPIEYKIEEKIEEKINESDIIIRENNEIEIERQNENIFIETTLSYAKDSLYIFIKNLNVPRDL